MNVLLLVILPIAIGLAFVLLSVGPRLASRQKQRSSGDGSFFDVSTSDAGSHGGADGHGGMSGDGGDCGGGGDAGGSH